MGNWPDTRVEGRGMFRAFDFAKCICKLDIELKRLKSLSRLGMVVMESERKRRISSAYDAILQFLFRTSMSLIYGLALNLRSMGSRVSTKIRGERGHPWLCHSKWRRCTTGGH